MNGTVQLVVPVLAAIVTGGCAAYVGLHKRLAPGARKYGIVMLAQAWWSLAYVAELLAPDLAHKVFWDDVQLPPPYLITLALLFSVYEYIGRSTRLIRRWLWALAVLPVASCAWVFSDHFHGLARATAHIADDPPFGALLYDFSTVELLSFAEVYAVSCYAVYRLLSHAAMQTEPHRRQALGRRRRSVELVRERARLARLSLVRPARFVAFVVRNQWAVRHLGAQPLSLVRLGADRA